MVIKCQGYVRLGKKKKKVDFEHLNKLFSPFSLFFSGWQLTLCGMGFHIWDYEWATKSCYLKKSGRHISPILALLRRA